MGSCGEGEWDWVVVAIEIGLNADVWGEVSIGVREVGREG